MKVNANQQKKKKKRKREKAYIKSHAKKKSA